MTECFDCGKPAVFDHHVVPASRGGTKTVPLCEECHGKAHHVNFNINHLLLTKEGLERAKRAGAQLGSARPGHWDGMVKEGPYAGISRIERRDAGLAKAQDRSREIVQEEMSRRYEPLVPWIREMREAGLTLQQIADNLNAKGCLTRYGRPWQLSTLHRVIQKYLGPEYLGQLNSKLRPVRVLSAANGG